MFNEEIKQSVADCVLCWLATVDKNGVPSVSPKEVFLTFAENEIIIANIASPDSVRNINQKPQVCVSFVDVFKQKGFKMKGDAMEMTQANSGYKPRYHASNDFAGGQYPIKSLIKIEIKSVRPIVAPSYYLSADITEEKQIQAALKTYGVKI